VHSSAFYCGHRVACQRVRSCTAHAQGSRGTRRVWCSATQRESVHVHACIMHRRACCMCVLHALHMPLVSLHDIRAGLQTGQHTDMHRVRAHHPRSVVFLTMVCGSSSSLVFSGLRVHDGSIISCELSLSQHDGTPPPTAIHSGATSLSHTPTCFLASDSTPPLMHASCPLVGTAISGDARHAFDHYACSQLLHVHERTSLGASLLVIQSHCIAFCWPERSLTGIATSCT